MFDTFMLHVLLAEEKVYLFVINFPVMLGHELLVSTMRSTVFLLKDTILW